MIKITLNILDDINQDELESLYNWDTQMKADPEKFKNIWMFNLEEGTYISIREMIAVNYEQFPIGEDERKNIILAKTTGNKIVGFMILSTHDLTTENPEIFLQELSVHPDYQKQGVGTQMLENLGDCLAELYGKYPKTMFAYISEYNIANISLFKKFGFEFKRNELHFLKATGEMPTKQKSLE